MADADSYIKPQKLVTEIGSLITPNQENPSKFYSHFLYKALIAAVCLVILPLFPSQAPEFINQTILTRNWELLHLLVVGIAVTYGLFSTLNVETEKENYSKTESVQSYMSRVLQVSSVFDDEVELEISSGSDENKIQTWNSRYFGGESVGLVAQENYILDEQSESSTSIGKKPLLLPVRSLRSQVSTLDALETTDESSGSSGSISRSGSGLRGSPSSNSSGKSRNGEFRGLDALEVERKLRENVVALPSPVPWGSRSGRMELKEELGSADESEFNSLRCRSFRTPLTTSSSSSSTSPSPKKLSPSPSVSLELDAKNVEDLGRKNMFNRSNPIPISNGISSQNKDMKKSSKDGLKDLPKRGDSRLDSLKSEVKPKTHIQASVVKPKTHKQGSPVGKSVRTIRASEPVSDVRKAREMVGGQVEDNGGKKTLEVEADLIENAGRKIAFSKLRIEEKKEFSQKVIVESEKESDSKVDEILGTLDKEEDASSNSFSDGGAGLSEVDKKADEFIAKFREQIRLQRVDSIKRSSEHHGIRNS